jgi:hypothetical protein
MSRTKPNGARLRGLALAERRRRVFAAWSKGRPQHLIADDEKVHHSQVTRDIDAVCKELHGRRLDESERDRYELLGKLAHAESELLAAWERSKQPRERRTTKTVRPGQGGKTAARDEGGKVTEGRDGNPKFMGELRALWELKARLAGILKVEGPIIPSAVTFVGGVDPAVVTGDRPAPETVPDVPPGP